MNKKISYTHWKRNWKPNDLCSKFYYHSFDVTSIAIWRARTLHTHKYTFTDTLQTNPWLAIQCCLFPRRRRFPMFSMCIIYLLEFPHYTFWLFLHRCSDFNEHYGLMFIHSRRFSVVILSSYLIEHVRKCILNGFAKRLFICCATISARYMVAICNILWIINIWFT